MTELTRWAWDQKSHSKYRAPRRGYGFLMFFGLGRRGGLVWWLSLSIKAICAIGCFSALRMSLNRYFLAWSSVVLNLSKLGAP